MTSSVSHKPTKPSLYACVRPAALLTCVGGAATGMWYGVAGAFAQTPAAFPGPTSSDLSHEALVAVSAFALSGAVYGARVNRWLTAREDQRVYEAVARILRVPTNERARRFRVAGRDGRTPTDVRVRVDSLPATRAERVRTNLARAFADALGVPVERVRTADARRAVRVWVTPPGAHTAPAHGARAVLAPAPEPEPVEAPVPVTPADATLQDQITEAMRGVLGNDKVAAVVTETHADGYPSELWVTYPPRLSAAVTEVLVRMRATLEQVAPSRADEWALRLVGPRCRVEFTDHTDPLAGLVALPDIDETPDLHKGVVVGITESGAPWHLPLMGGMHTLVAGASQAGKGSVLWNVVRAIGPMIRDGRARLWLIDPKGGMEFSAAQPIAHRFAVSVAETKVVLEELKRVMEAKARTLAADKRRKIETPTREEPLDLLIVDELANVTGLAGREGDVIGDLIASLCSMGRAPAVTVIGALQDPRKETFRHRGLFTSAVALRLREAGETNLVLGQGARAQGALADLIPKKYPGIGYVIRDDRAEPERVRTGFVSDEEIAALVKRSTPPLDAPPIGEPIGSTVQDPLEKPNTRKRPRQLPPPPRRTAAAARPVKVADLTELPVVARFDGDEDPVTITAVDPSHDEPGRLLVTYSYAGQAETVTDVDDTETVTLIP